MSEIGSYQENMQHLKSLGVDASKGKVSGGTLINFTQGWALPKYSFGKAHYFKTNKNGVVYAICGTNVNANWEHGDLMAKGSFDACIKCQRIASVQKLPTPTIQPVKESST